MIQLEIIIHQDSNVDTYHLSLVENQDQILHQYHHPSNQSSRNFRADEVVEIHTKKNLQEK